MYRIPRWCTTASGSWHTLRRAGLPLPERFAWDTMLGAYLVNPQERSYGLGALCPNAPEDARSAWALYKRQAAKLEADRMMMLMREVEMPLSMVLFRMEAAGFTVDGAFLRALGERYTVEIEQARQAVFAACGVKPFNLNSTQQLGEVLFEQLQLPHGKKTQRGYSTSAEVLEGLRDIAPEVIDRCCAIGS